MKMTIEKNRRFAFLAALEVLLKNTDQMIERVRLDLDFEDTPEFEEKSGEIGASEDVLGSLDDALIDFEVERNRYIETEEIESDRLELRWQAPKK